MPSKAQNFIAYLQEKLDNRAYAILRRSLADKQPGDYIPAFPYIERFVQDNPDGVNSYDERRGLYLVAGLYCLLNRPLTPGDTDEAEHSSKAPEKTSTVYNLGHSVAWAHQKKYPNPGEEPTSLERRFLLLLDADEQQLGHFLRQMIMIIKDEPIDWVQLTKDLLYWNTQTKQKWAKGFYQELFKQKKKKED